MNEITNTFKISLLLIMAIAGAFDTISFKSQNSQIIQPPQRYFYHPYMQAATMFLGQALSLLIFKLMKMMDDTIFYIRVRDSQRKGKEINYNKLWLAIPALCDLIASTTNYVVFSFIPRSSFQLINGGLIISSYIFSLLYLKLKINKSQKLGCLIALIGVVLVGITSIIFTDNPFESTKKEIIGYLLVVTSLFITSFVLVFEQKLLEKYHIQPMEMVGYEGLFGLAGQIVIIIITTYTKCDPEVFGINGCHLRGENYYFQDPQSYFNSVINNGYLLMYGLLGVFSIAIFNIVGVTVTKYINALSRSICNVSRVIFVWVLDVIVTLTYGRDLQNYRWQILKVSAILMNLFGFFLLIIGNLAFNRIIALPFIGKDEKQEILSETSDKESSNCDTHSLLSH